MNIHRIETEFGAFARSEIFSHEQRKVFALGRDVIAALRAANGLADDFDASALLPLIWHKSQLPERPQAIIRLPSGDSSAYDRFTVLPEGLSLASALALANQAIVRANHEDHESANGGCVDGDDVEGNVRRHLEALGFMFLPVEQTVAWDSYHGEPSESPAEGLSEPEPPSRTSHDTSAAAEYRYRALCTHQGWSSASEIAHLEGFMRAEGLFERFVQYASNAAAEENVTIC